MVKDSSAERVLGSRSQAVMNLALRGIEADFGPEHADTFRRDLSTAFQSATLFLKAT